jgi:inosose dehydratase
MTPTRRQFAAAAVAAVAATTVRAADKAPAVPLITNVYPWGTFYTREKKDFNKDLDAGLAAVKKAGLDGFEPVLNSPAEVKTLGELLPKHGLVLKSFYVNSKLHDKADADASVKSVLAIAEAAKGIGAGVVVTNPSPIKWGGAENKSDDQLKLQAEKLNELGAGLKKLGLVLAYHNHDIELRHAAREFHHMLTATDAANVKFCLDSHWVFRGAGDSQVALFDAVTHYADRIVELHLRQSKGGVWTEAFEDGDIDYARLWAVLTAKKLTPLLVLEQAVEAKSANTMTAVDAHTKSAAYARKLFGL